MSTSPKERFEALFGPNSTDRPGLPSYLRAAVFDRIRIAFEETDGRKLRSVRSYLAKEFHPDRRSAVFSTEEQTAVFVTLDHVFKGTPL
ncbi:hypothetical protein PB2503_05792 [Parvularcula bermudensis HTCC2503]|uniref:Uncharacterized protein n=1 Tax=Parvularcula bermudensis (strain ATCC BAA-594 / HTCC2503 / KCTC 12087) TaxID=314260 RepID=E0TGY9_PARBH|nr:hypothetical protein [Parvularcula bermudensis]ADM09229.1 hypothetical protein PB2503_05792 [Parvularcula bermudensis HTCC2503]